jgi:hypothetical protein
MGKNDTSFATVSSPSSVKFKDTGLKEVTLIIEDQIGCRDTQSQKVRILANPLAKWVVDTTWNCLRGNQFNFNTTGSQGVTTNSITAYSWNFGTGASSANATGSGSRSVKYSNAGAKRIVLKVEDRNGCVDSLVSNVTVRPHPIAKLNVDTTELCFRGNMFNFHPRGSSASGISTQITRYIWNFDVNNSTPKAKPASQNVRTASDFKVAYSFAGNYRISLLLKDTNGCHDTVYKNIKVNEHPVASFTINDEQQCLKNASFNFNASNSKGVTSNSVNTYRWNFGLGASVSGWNNYTATSVNNIGYSTYNKRNIYLIVIDKNTCSDTLQKEVEVYDNPNAIYGVNDSIQCFSDHNYTFNSTNSKAGNGQTLSSIYWDFGADSRVSNATTDTVKNVTFRTSGYKKIRLIVGNANGCYDTINFTIHIRSNPIAKLTVDNDSLCNKGHSFNFNSTNSTIVTNVLSYSWNFGGATSNTQGTVANPKSIKYSTAGNKNIKFVLTDRNGCVDSTKTQIWIFENPTAVIGISSADSLCLRGNSWNLSSTNSSSRSGLGLSGYVWKTEETNNQSYNASSVNGVKYTTAGNKKLTLSVQDANGCWDTAYKTINVKPHPTADFTITTLNSQCLRDRKSVV